MRTYLVAAMAPILLLVSGGCGGDGSTANSESTTASTPTASTATTEQYASLVAQNEFSEALNSFMSDCAFFNSTFCTDRAELIGRDATELADALSAAPDAIGEPPAEVATLVSDTVNDAESVADASSAWQAECADAATFPATDQACQDSWDLVQITSDDLRNTVAGWDPYI